MAFQYPSYAVPQGYNGVSNVGQSYKRGYDATKSIVDENNAAQTLGDLGNSLATPSTDPSKPGLDQFGLPAREVLLPMLQNPQTRDQAIALVKQAQAARAEATDPLRQLQIKKAQYDVQHQGDGPGPSAEMRLFREAQSNPEFAQFIAAKGADKAPPAVQTYMFYRDQERAAGREPLDWLGYQAKVGELDNTNPSFGVTPIWGQLPDGTFGYGVQGKDGTFKKVNTGDLKPLDPRSLNSEKAFGTATGTATGQAVAAAPNDIASADTALGLVDQIKTSPELDWATGTAAGLGANNIPGTGRFGFQKLVDQAKSGAFLTAIQQMRGLGALSNNEGSAATEAVTRLNTALSKDDFVKALNDYESIIKKGQDRAKTRLTEQRATPAAPTTSSGGAPSAGEVMDGYRFKGGDPADQNNWEAAQ